MQKFQGKRVLIIGAARQGIALASYLAAQGAQIVLNDQRKAESLVSVTENLSHLSIEWVFGSHPLSLLNQIDLVYPSGGVPLTLPIIIEASKRSIPLSNDSQVFLDAAPCKVIGITGSAGKTTTTSLVGRMAASSGQDVWVGGNIGNPLISDIENVKVGDLAVMELSSFQLDLMTSSPQIAALLNITPNHLDRHVTMDAYTAAKARVLAFQQPSDVAILGRDDPGAWAFAQSIHGDCISFGVECPPQGQIGTFLRDEWVAIWDGNSSQDLFPISSILLRGEHNLLNVLAAAAIAHSAGITPDAMQAGVESFSGVAHRLEFVRSWGGAAWYNDSVATAPERTMAAIRSFNEPLILLVGGRDKDLPWEDFAELVSKRVNHLIIFGEAAEKIYQAVDAVQTDERPISVQRCPDLEMAVEAAAKIVEPGYVVLLSPGGTSFDQFQDFAERGEWYRKWVMQLK
ncbi:MAG: UDP-N-acetylmuramoyl-L-alanine--D-glutamate ligase [Chloroflexota bacterium]